MLMCNKVTKMSFAAVFSIQLLLLLACCHLLRPPVAAIITTSATVSQPTMQHERKQARELQQSDPQHQRYFYVYDWPKEYGDVWPQPGAELVPDSPYDHGFYDNHGAGKLLSPELGLYQTWQFAAYKNAMSRLLHSKYRTLDPTKASAFVLPFDGGVHSYIDHQTGKKRLASPHAWSVRWTLQQIANNETLAPIFWKNRGHDHFVFFSLTAFVMTGIGIKEFWTDICQNCSALTVETTPTLTSTTYHRSRKYWYAIPYPSSFHWYEGIPNLPWAALPLPLSSASSSASSSAQGVPQGVLPQGVPQVRDVFALFIGSVKTLNPRANVLRRRLHDQCLAATAALASSDASTALASATSPATPVTPAGAMNSATSGGSGASSAFTPYPLVPSCQWHHTAHSCKALANLTAQMSLFRRAVFCPAPPGDSVTRKSLFDSLVAGCIPVLFAKASLQQYVWFLSPEEVDAATIYIPLQQVLQGSVDFMQVLRDISAEDIQRKQQVIAKLAPRLQYSVVPERIYQQEQQLQQGQGEGREGQGPVVVAWEPPFEDASSIIIQRLLHPDTSAPLQGFSREQLRRQKCLQHELMRRHEAYGGLYHGTAHLGGASGNVFRRLKCEELDFSHVNFSQPCFRKGEAEQIAQL